MSKECTKSPNDFSKSENVNLLSNEFWFKSLPSPPSISSPTNDKDKCLYLESINSDVYDNANSFNTNNQQKQYEQTVYAPINFNKTFAPKLDNNGSGKKSSFYQEPKNNTNSNDMSTFSNSATLLINTNSKIENPLATNTLYSQVYPSSHVNNNSLGRTPHKKANSISSRPQEVNLYNNEKTILIDTSNGEFIKPGSNCKTNTLPTNDAFTSKLPPVPRRNSKNMLMQNSNTNLNVLPSSHNINKTYSELNQQQKSHQDPTNHLNSLMSLNKSKLYQKI